MPDQLANKSKRWRFAISVRMLMLLVAALAICLAEKTNRARD